MRFSMIKNRGRWTLGVVCAFLVALAFAVQPTLAKEPSQKQINAVKKAMPGKAPAEPKKDRRILMIDLCKGYTHGVIPLANEAFRIMGEKTGAFETDLVHEMSVFTKQNLRKYDAVLFNNTTHLTFTDAQREALMDFVKGGKGIIGAHAATDNFYKWPEAQKMIGGKFTGHPWTAGGTWAFKLDEPDHPINAGFDGEGFLAKDEIYKIGGAYTRENLRVLVSLDMANERNHVKGFTEGDFGVSWIRNYGKGRLFYCSLGHNAHIFWTEDILEHYLAGIQFALGDLEADATPSAELEEKPEPARTVATSGPYIKILDYEWGKSESGLADIKAAIRGASKSKLKKIEKRLMATLQSPKATFACKQFVCRMLRRMGTKECVPVLSEFLNDEEMSHMARFALQGIPAAEADVVLRHALDKVSGDLQAGIISTIGERGDRKAVPQIADLLESSNDAVVGAAVSALGRIGGARAADALSNADLPEKYDVVAAHAMCQCADSLTDEGKTAQAVEIYRKLFQDSSVVTARNAALRGLARAQGAEAVPLLLEALDSEAVMLREAAAKFVREVPGEGVSKELAKRMSSLDTEGKVMVLSALAERGDKSVASDVANAAKSDNERVRAAALNALQSLGGAEQIPMLTQQAARGGAAGEAAFGTLARLSGPGINEALVKQAKSASPKVQNAAIKALAERGYREAVPTLMQTAGADDGAVRKASFEALAELAGGRALSRLVRLLAEAPPQDRSAAEDAVVATAKRVEDKNERTRPVIGTLDHVDEIEARTSLIRVLGKLGGRNALEEVQEHLDSDSGKIREAAVRALAEWPDPSATDVLMELAEDAESNTHRILALRGYIRIVGEAGMSAEDKVEMYAEALEVAERNQEKKRALAGLGKVAHIEALELAEEYMDESGLEREARTAAVQIAESILAAQPRAARDVLERVASEAQSDRLRKQAKEALDRAKTLSAYILNWKLAGPYTKEDQDGTQLFDVAFAPEKDGGKVDWRRVKGVTDSGQPWLVSLETLIGGNNRVAYLSTRVYSPKKQKARLEMGSDDGIKVWLNGEMVHANNATRPASRGQDKADVTLQKGWNPLLVKCTQSGGHWAVCVAVRDRDGKQIDGLRVSPQ